MPPRLTRCARRLRVSTLPLRPPPSCACRYATAQAMEQTRRPAPPIAPYPPTQPPSHRPPEFRRSQLHRQYTSALRSMPMMLLYQHNNLTAVEWTGVRRELAAALRRVDASRSAGREEEDGGGDLADGIKIQVVQGGVFDAALRVVEYFRPEHSPAAAPAAAGPVFTHGLSRAAHKAAINKRLRHELAPLLSGPLAVVLFPKVSTEHLKAALCVLSPNAPDFPAPTRRANPGYHDPSVQLGLKKLLLLAARVEGTVFDLDGTRWVGGIQGGLEGLQGQLVAMLQGVGGLLTNTLESASRSLYLTVESRRAVLEEEQDGGKKVREESTAP